MKDKKVKILMDYFKIQRMNKHQHEYKILADDLYQEARVNMNDMYDENGKLKKISEMDEHLQSNLKIKIKAQKATKTDDGMYYQPTLFGDNHDVEIEWDGKARREARTQYLQLIGMLDNNNDKENE